MTDLLNPEHRSTTSTPSRPRRTAEPARGWRLLSSQVLPLPNRFRCHPAVNVDLRAPPGGLGVNAVTLAQGRRKDYWSGVDTNFVLRAKGGLRISGGTSTGKRTDNTCELLFDGNPPSRPDTPSWGVP